MAICQMIILLEFARRGSLDTVLTKSDINITFASHILQMLSQASQALAFVHTKGLIHMDVKSSNILVRQDWSVALGDFGEIERENKDGDCVGKTSTTEFDFLQVRCSPAHPSQPIVKLPSQPIPYRHRAR